MMSEMLVPIQDEYLALTLCPFFVHVCVCEHRQLEEIEWVSERWLR